MYASLAAIVLLAVGAIATSDRSCNLGTVHVMPHVDEHALAGRWYKMRGYFSSRYNPKDSYSDYVLDLVEDKKLPGFTEYLTYRDTSFEPNACRNDKNNRTKLDNGKYLIDVPAFRNAQKWVIDTDYCNFFIEFQCLKISGDICIYPEVLLYTRNPHYNEHDLKLAMYRYEHIFKDSLCTNNDVAVDIIQKNEGKCTAEKPEYFKDLYGYYGKGYGYGGYGYGGYGYGGYGYGGYGYGNAKDGKGYGYGYPYGKGYGYGLYAPGFCFAPPPAPAAYPGYGYGYGYGNLGGYGYGGYGYGGYGYGGYGYGKGYGGYGYGGYGYGKGYGKYGKFEKEYKEIREARLANLQADTASELAETEKLNAEKATQILEKQKVELEIELIKKGKYYYHPAPARPAYPYGK